MNPRHGCIGNIINAESVGAIRAHRETARNSAASFVSVVTSGSASSVPGALQPVKMITTSPGSTLSWKTSRGMERPGEYTLT